MDPIADMFATIKNASAVNKEMVVIPYSELKMEIAKLLQTQGYIKDVSKKGKKTKKFIEITLLYNEGKPAFKEIRRVSKPSRRIYSAAKDLKLVRNSGMRILSTPKGILSDKIARKEKVGGEIIGEIYK